MLRVESGLFFANAEHVCATIHRTIQDAVDAVLTGVVSLRD